LTAATISGERALGMTPPGVELRHLRYFVAVADAGTFTRAAERRFIAQPTMSQQIRRLEEMVGTPLLQRRREGVRLTDAGTVLLEESRIVLSLVDHGVSRTRQVAGVGRPRLRFVVPPYLPEPLAVETASRLRTLADAAGVDVAWIEKVLDAEFSLVRDRRADAGLGWLTAGKDTLPAPLDVMSLGKFEPDVWLPADHPAASRRAIGLQELARLDVIHGPRRVGAASYDAWLAVMQPGFRLRRPTVPPVAADDPRVCGHGKPADRGAYRTAASHGGPLRIGAARSGGRPGRHGPGQHRPQPVDRHCGPGLEWGPAARASASAVRYRRQHRALTCLPAARSALTSPASP